MNRTVKNLLLRSNNNSKYLERSVNWCFIGPTGAKKPRASDLAAISLLCVIAFLGASTDLPNAHCLRWSVLTASCSLLPLTWKHGTEARHCCNGRDVRASCFWHRLLRRVVVQNFELVIPLQTVHQTYQVRPSLLGMMICRATPPSVFGGSRRRRQCWCGSCFLTHSKLISSWTWYTKKTVHFPEHFSNELLQRSSSPSVSHVQMNEWPCCYLHEQHPCMRENWKNNYDHLKRCTYTPNQTPVCSIFAVWVCHKCRRQRHHSRVNGWLLIFRLTALGSIPGLHALETGFRLFVALSLFRLFLSSAKSRNLTSFATIEILLCFLRCLCHQILTIRLFTFSLARLPYYQLRDTLNMCKFQRLKGLYGSVLLFEKPA